MNKYLQQCEPKLNRLYAWIKPYTTLLFYLGLSLEIFYVLWDKSDFIIPSEGILFRITFVIFFFKMLGTKYTKKEWCVIFGMCILGVIAWKCSSRNDMLRIVVLCAACKDQDLRKMLGYTFWTTLAGCLLLVGLAFAGILGEVAITDEYRANLIETRYVFGMGHPNAFHCMFFALMLLGMYLWFEKLRWHTLCIVFAVNLCLFYFTDSKTGFLMGTFAVLLAGIMCYTKRLRDWKGIYILGILGVIVLAGFSLAVAYYGLVYNNNGLWEEPHFNQVKQLDQIFTGRLWNAYGYPDSHIGNFRLFSQPANNRYMDMGFYKLFYWYGYIPGFLYLIACCMLIWRCYKEKDYAGYVFLVPWLFYNIWEAHEISDYIGRNYIYLMWGAYWVTCLDKNRWLDDKINSMKERIHGRKNPLIQREK